MARIRTIKPSFFKNEELAELPIAARVLFIGLWCLADVEGRLEDRPKRIKAEIFPYDDIDVEDALSKLTESRFINRYEVGSLKVVEVINFNKHQRITGSEASTESEFPQNECFTEKETPRKHFGNTQDDRKGREGKGKDIGKGKGGTEFTKHFFSESEIFDKQIFDEKLLGTAYELANVDWYHEQIKNWADSKNEKKFNWLAAAKNWMASDMKDGKFITKDFKPPVNGNHKNKPGSKVESVQSAFSKIDSMPD